MNTSTLSIGLALVAGLLSVLSPWVLPILPVLVRRSLQSHIYGQKNCLELGFGESSYGTLCHPFIREFSLGLLPPKTLDVIVQFITRISMHPMKTLSRKNATGLQAILE